jgi:FAD/FMN-containing dehydrogenase
MTGIDVTTRFNKSVTVSEQAVKDLAARLRGKLLLAGEPGYDEARAVWNAMIDRRPALIVRCAGAADVIAALEFANSHGALVAVRGGGHNIAGTAVCEGGVMIDLSAMKSVRIDPVARTARVEPGVTLGEFDREAQAFGLATPVGINSTTGVAGLTLGGGFGWTSRKFGLTVDNLLSADVVTADGKLVRASESENPDLFWAIRGGGGNFGIVTSFEFRLHALGPQVISGVIVHPIKDAMGLLRRYREIVATAPEELSAWAVLRKAPPLPFLPAEVHGTGVLIFAGCYAGPMEAGEPAFAQLRKLGTPIADMIGPHPFTGWQAAFDPLLEKGARNYWKSHDFAGITDDAIGAIVDYANRLPGPECEIFLGHLGGAVNRVAEDATAYPHRDTEFVLNVHTRWRAPEQDEECVGWARSFYKTMEPFANGGVYVNFMPADETDRLPGAYRANAARLAAIKAKYDPDNVFRVNQNIKPAR